MNALPKITARALTLPAYDNRNLQHGALWVRDNIGPLRERYEALGKALPDETSADATAEFPRAQAFVAFCTCAWDIERMRQ